jgi:DNA-binding transcriptional regulator YdaS (Cro superfamily)
MQNIPPSPIERACDKAGSQARLARILQVSPTVVNQWVRGVRPVPAPYCPQIEIETGVSRKELRPNDWQLIWPELAKK